MSEGLRPSHAKWTSTLQIGAPRVGNRTSGFRSDRGLIIAGALATRPTMSLTHDMSAELAHEMSALRAH
jgi:hypothetical protein